ncbi:Fungal specific transcription factor domain-containing protein isoform 3 [Cladophialophora immunda]|nr:Fungal specific transcription factor domain-containing protein isoform 3 [Cladophialophora immunda]
MLAGAGRPRKACSRCKNQKVRCSGEKPTCKRCSRSNHLCLYKATDGQRSSKATSHSNATKAPMPQWHGPAVRPEFPPQGSYVGIPMTLIMTLVDVYYASVYNASLLLHKRLFIEAIASGTARPHVVLSVCAWALNFYRGPDGRSALCNHDFSTEWADQAGKLAFQEVENPTDEHIVTFMNLALFWYSQGSWRRSVIHKGTAAQIAHLLGLGTDRPGKEDMWQSEIRRRRFWACYLMHCHAIETCAVGASAENTLNLTLPWTEEDFDAGVATNARVCLKSGDSNGGIFAELIKALTFWCEVNALVKSPESSTSERLQAIYALDDRISKWRTELPDSLQLTVDLVTEIPDEALPNLLLLHIVHHQCLCALHASVVPLFCWSAADATWSAARQMSAQVAYDNACAASVLIDAVLSSFRRLSAIPSFVAYAAYCGAAIQIPFMWSTEPTVKQRAYEHVRANTKMIRTLAKYWKFAALLESHVRYIYQIHANHPTILENEPKYIDPKKLTSFRTNAVHARESILGHNRILWRNGNALPSQGEEVADLGPEDESDGEFVTGRAALDMRGRELVVDAAIQPKPLQTSRSRSLTQAVAPPSRRDCDRARQQISGELLSMPLPPPFPYAPPPPPPIEVSPPGMPSLDFFRPFHDPEMLDSFPNGQAMDFSLFEASPSSLDFLELWPSGPA